MGDNKNPGTHIARCPTCGGSGKRGNDVCGLCKGTGVIRVTP